MILQALSTNFGNSPCIKKSIILLVDMRKSMMDLISFLVVASYYFVEQFKNSLNIP